MQRRDLLASGLASGAATAGALLQAARAAAPAAPPFLVDQWLNTARRSMPRPCAARSAS